MNAHPASPTIREATDADAEALFALHLEALQAHPGAFAADPAETAATEGAWIGRLQRRLAAGTGTICLATDPEDNSVIGMSGIFCGMLAKTAHMATIWGMYVQPPWRGQGLAGRLLQACLAWAQRRDVYMVRLAVVATNTAAIRCYVTHGFSVYGVEPAALRHDGVYYDELLMARRVPRKATRRCALPG